jgi:hypothetical protein
MEKPVEIVFSKIKKKKNLKLKKKTNVLNPKIK